MKKLSKKEEKKVKGGMMMRTGNPGNISTSSCGGYGNSSQGGATRFGTQPKGQAPAPGPGRSLHY